MQKFIFCFLLLILSIFPLVVKSEFSQGRVVEEMGDILSHRERIEPSNRILKHRLENLLPQLMRAADIDMWVVINREYVENALYFSLVPQPSFAARRTTILVFFDQGEGKPLEKITISRYPLKDFYRSEWEGGTLQQQWKRLAELIEEKAPKQIGLNYSKDWPLSDGLTHGLFLQLEKHVSEKYRQRFVSAENLVVRWLETRTEPEIQIYPHIVSLARRVIGEAFSNKVITPGVTTTQDVAWYIRERFEALQLRPWFQPSVNLQRRGDKNSKDAPFYGRSDAIIQPGDVLHTDVGICYLKMCTDTQEMGYVLKLDEKDVPKGLKKALSLGNKWQNLLAKEFKTGSSGNTILANNLKASRRAKLIASTYTHPIGFVGHGSGPTIGMWDNQSDTPIKGDWQLYANTAYAIEGNIKTRLPEWDNEWIQIKLEQTALFDGRQVNYLAGRQLKWHLVK